MHMDFAKFDQMIDLDALRHDIDKAASGSGEYEEIPLGQYEVRVERLELKESKSGKPMVSAWFKVIAGDYEGNMIFMNQVIVKPFQIHLMNQFLRSLKTPVTVDFVSYSDYAEVIGNVFGVAQTKEYALDYGERNGFKTFTIIEVFE